MGLARSDKWHNEVLAHFHDDNPIIVQGAKLKELPEVRAAPRIQSLRQVAADPKSRHSFTLAEEHVNRERLPLAADELVLIDQHRQLSCPPRLSSSFAPF